MIEPAGIAMLITGRLYGAAAVAALTAGSLRFAVADRPQRWCAGWLGASVLGQLAGDVLAKVIQNSTDAARIWFVFSSALAVSVLAATVGDPRWRQRLFVAAAAVFVVMAALTLTIESKGEFAKLTGPLHGLTVLVVGASIVLSRAHHARRDLLRDSTFLIGAGFLLIGAPSGFLSIYARMPGVENRELTHFLYAFKNLLAILAYATMMRAFLLPGGGKQGTAP